MKKKWFVVAINGRFEVSYQEARKVMKEQGTTYEWTGDECNVYYPPSSLKEYNLPNIEEVWTDDKLNYGKEKGK